MNKEHEILFIFPRLVFTHTSMLRTFNNKKKTLGATEGNKYEMT